MDNYIRLCELRRRAKAIVDALLEFDPAMLGRVDPCVTFADVLFLPDDLVGLAPAFADSKAKADLDEEEEGAMYAAAEAALEAIRSEAFEIRNDAVQDRARVVRAQIADLSKDLWLEEET